MKLNYGINCNRKRYYMNNKIVKMIKHLKLSKLKKKINLQLIKERIIPIYAYKNYEISSISFIKYALPHKKQIISKADAIQIKLETSDDTDFINFINITKLDFICATYDNIVFEDLEKIKKYIDNSNIYKNVFINKEKEYKSIIQTLSLNPNIKDETLKLWLELCS